jgi:hypothetical protein
MGHADKRRISAWLKDLRQKQYIDWIYDPTNPGDMSKPAIYFLGTNGIRLLRQAGAYCEAELKKRYKDASRQPSYIASCLLLVGCCLHLEGRNQSMQNATYSYAVKADMAEPDSTYHYLRESDLAPDLAFIKQVPDEDPATYLLQLLDLTTPRYMVKSRIRGYVDFLGSGEWNQPETGAEPPIVLVACPSLPELIFAKRYAKKRLKELDLEDSQNLRVRFAIIEQVKKQGLTAIIWEQA